MSNDLEILMESIYLGRFPQMWSKYTPETEENLSNWLIHFRKRHDQYEEWFRSGEPKVMWLCGLHVPEAHLTVLLQTAFRTRGWPLDETHFKF
jgi:dynein heavy chain